MKLKNLRLGSFFIAGLFTGLGCGGTPSNRSDVNIAHDQTSNDTLAPPQSLLKTYRFNRLELQVPDDWDVSSDPRISNKNEDTIRIMRPDGSKLLFVRVSPANGEQQKLPGTLRMTALHFIHKMSELHQFNMDDGKNEGGSGDELWGRKGFLVNYVSHNNMTQLPVRISVFGQYLEETDDIFFIHGLVVGEENGELEAIVQTLKIRPLQGN